MVVAGFSLRLLAQVKTCGYPDLLAQFESCGYQANYSLKVKPGIIYKFPYLKEVEDIQR